MARKNYSEEFSRQAVDFYESTPGATVAGIAEDLWHLEANWVSPIATAFTAAFGSIGCAILAAVDHGLAAWWFFEAFFVVAAASAVRLLWIFRSMVRLARESDSARLSRSRDL